MEFGEKLKALRQEKKLTQWEVAKAIGISRRAYMAYERENVRPRKMDTYSRLAKVLGCEMDYLFVKMEALEKALKEGITNYAGAVSALQENFRLQITEGNLRYIQKQRHFQAIALGILYTTLREQGISFRPGDKRSLSANVSLPDEFIVLDDVKTSAWWLRFCSKDSIPGGDSAASIADKASDLICQFTTASYDEHRKISIIVDDEALFNALAKFKNHNSFNGNMSAILLDTENVSFVTETWIAELPTAELFSLKEG